MDLGDVPTSDWINASATLLVGLVVVVAFKRGVQAASRPLRLQEDAARILTRVVIAVVVLITVIGAMAQLGVHIGPLLGALGIGSILIAMSLQPVLGNLVGSVMLDARRPIRRGDQIHSNGHSGTVIDINGRAVVVKSFNGEIVYLPNLKVLDEPLVNQTRDHYRRTLMPFQVSYDTDLRKTQEVLCSVLRSLPSQEGAPPADIIVTGFGESGVSLEARFWHPAEELTARWIISEVAIAIRETLATEGITIPFPQLVLHHGSQGHSTPSRSVSEQAASTNGSLAGGQVPPVEDDPARTGSTSQR